MLWKLSKGADDVDAVFGLSDVAVMAVSGQVLKG